MLRDFVWSIRLSTKGFKRMKEFQDCLKDPAPFIRISKVHQVGIGQIAKVTDV